MIDTSYPVVTGTEMFAGQMLDPNGSYWRFGTLDQSDTFHTIFDSMWQPYVPLRLAFDGGEMFWTGTTTTLYRAHLTDTTFLPDARFLGGFAPFGVTGDAILFNFTRLGYDSIPR